MPRRAPPAPVPSTPTLVVVVVVSVAGLLLGDGGTLALWWLRLLLPAS